MAEKTGHRQVAWTVGRLAGRRLLGRKDGETDVHLGELLTSQLDEMKGLGMKLGQIVSYLDVPLPESVLSELARLQKGVTGMSEAETKSALAAALGDDFATFFEEFSYKTIAAASIGQVHRARWEGQEIALKLQYPQVSQSFHKDLSAINKIAALASLASAVDGTAIVRELGARLDEECDYQREATYQRAFASAFSEVDGIVIPRVIERLCTRTTLATSFAEGIGLVEARLLPQEVRNEIAKNLAVFNYRSLLVLATIQADPHPGNYLFGADGQVTCLDFGCVRHFEAPYVEQLREMIRALDRGDRKLFRQSVIELGLAPRPKKFNFDHHFEMMDHLHRPLLEPRFSFTPEFVQKGLAYNGPLSPNARHLGMPPEYIWVARLQWGLWSLLTRLGATVTLRDVYDSLVAQPITPLAGI